MVMGPASCSMYVRGTFIPYSLSAFMFIAVLDVDPILKQDYPEQVLVVE